MANLQLFHQGWRNQEEGVAQVPPDWGRSVYLTLTEGRADHAYQITTCPLLLPILKPATSPVTQKFHPYSIFTQVNKGGIRRL